MTGKRGINVLIVDDSAIVRKIFSEILSACPDIQSVRTAPDALVARNKILVKRPDVITLDLDARDGRDDLPQKVDVLSPRSRHRDQLTGSNWLRVVARSLAPRGD